MIGEVAVAAVICIEFWLIEWRCGGKEGTLLL